MPCVARTQPGTHSHAHTRARRYTFGGYAEAGWGGSLSYATEAAGDFLFRLGPGAAAAYRPTGADTHNQLRAPADWPAWGDGADLGFGAHGALGTNGFCNQGTTYAGAPNAACGGHGNWGATEMEVWYPVP